VSISTRVNHGCAGRDYRSSGGDSVDSCWGCTEGGSSGGGGNGSGCGGVRNNDGGDGDSGGGIELKYQIF